MNKQSSDDIFDPMGQIPFEEEAKAYRRVNKLMSLFWGLLIGSCILMYFGLPIFIGIPIAVIAVIMEFFVLTGKRKALEPYMSERKKWVEQKKLLPILGEFFQVRSFQGEEYIDRPELAGYGNKGNNKMDATYRDIDFVFSNLTQEYIDTDTDMDDKGRRGVKFSGSLLLCPLKRSCADEQLESLKKDLTKAAPVEKGKYKIERCADDPTSYLIFIPRRLFAGEDAQKTREDAAFLKTVLDTLLDATF